MLYAYYILTKINIHAQYLIYRLLNNIIHLKIIQFLYPMPWAQ